MLRYAFYSLLKSCGLSDFPYHVHTQGGILITGASTGIGAHAVQTLAAKGFHVFAGVRSQKDGDQLKAESSNPERIHVLILDVTVKEHIEAAVKVVKDTLEKEGLQLVGLVNNAGLSGFLSTPCTGVYAATKHAVEAFTDALRQELTPHRVSVSLLQPGVILTRIWEKYDFTLRLWDATPPALKTVYSTLFEREAVAAQNATKRGVGPHVTSAAIVDALMSPVPKTRYKIGTDAWFVGLLKRWLPDRALDYVLLHRPVS
ncbi:hypothetical protein HK104_009980 [Borealophlyctis nickersoniae]|nr:hypothetical protein HK104_009980 [Borealophlyctis nickersoniae]